MNASASSAIIQLEPSWLTLLKAEFEKPYMQRLRAFLIEEKRHHKVYPLKKDIFSAFWLTPFTTVKVVILGQDPYHGRGQAHGLCFSVPEGMPSPPSLVNIFKELEQDLGIPNPKTGCLSSWAKQGVFLLNTILTVRQGSPRSHQGQGWEDFTNTVIRLLGEQQEHLVFLLWGKDAQEKQSLISKEKHLLLKAPHPSPYSADRGFFGSKPFSKANDYLKQHGKKPITWNLSS